MYWEYGNGSQIRPRGLECRGGMGGHHRLHLVLVRRGPSAHHRLRAAGPLNRADVELDLHHLIQRRRGVHLGITSAFWAIVAGVLAPALAGRKQLLETWNEQRGGGG